MLTLLTTTGCRPEAWAICEKLMINQTYQGNVRWVIVDDGAEKQTVTLNRSNWITEVITPSHVWQPGMNTQQKNLLAGLRHINNNENLVIIEDDDYYAPEYLSITAEMLKVANLVGQSGARYYNIKNKKYRQLPNLFHSSLCSTAMKADAIEFFRAVCTSKDTLIDVELWKKYKGTKRLYKSDSVVGIKGMPGREGIGVGHKQAFQGKIDKDGSVFKDWLKSDVGLYEQH